MASIHITEIQKILAERGENDAVPFRDGGFFLEILFDDLSSGAKRSKNAVDDELSNKVITSDSPYGQVTIQFDEYGMLKSLDLS